MAVTTTRKEISGAGEISVEECRTSREMLEDWSLVRSIKPEFNVKGAYSKAVGRVLKIISAQNAKISCILHAKPPVLNRLGRLHGLVVASVSERVEIACAKTVVGKDLFLGELSISYLSSSPRNASLCAY
ncbi:hypothetical protein OROMI_021758 [Orobanche minor]